MYMERLGRQTVARSTATAAARGCNVFDTACANGELHKKVWIFCSARHNDWSERTSSVRLSLCFGALSWLRTIHYKLETFAWVVQQSALFCIPLSKLLGVIAG